LVGNLPIFFLGFKYSRWRFVAKLQIVNPNN
jgi:hypothetical protein